VQEPIFPARPVRVEGAADIVQTAAAQGVTGPPKHPGALPQGDSGIDGTMRRPVAAVEARRSRSLSVADDRGRHGRVGKKRGVPNPWSVPSEESYAGSHCNIARIRGIGSSSHENTSSTQPSTKMCPVTLARSYECVSFFPSCPPSHPARWLIQHAPNGLCV
jgi:hypothetical protein